MIPLPATPASRRALLAWAARLGFPQVLYRSPILNERFVIPRGSVPWQAWAADCVACDVERVEGVLEAIAKDRELCV